MDKLTIKGGNSLQGTIEVGGAKNAALPLMAASLLTEDPLTLHNIPSLSDIATKRELLTHLGVQIKETDRLKSTSSFSRSFTLDARSTANTIAPYDIVRKMRASVVVLGPLLARFKQARVSLPGGCAIGTRPIDYHLNAFEAMGAKISIEEGYVEASAPDGLQAAEIDFPEVSVGATENALMAASLAEGTTRLNNAAREPEVTDLARLLLAMGAEIDGIGTSTLTIHGKPALHGAEHTVLSDRIEAGSYAIAAAITGGEITLKHAPVDAMKATLDALEKAGIGLIHDEDGLKVIAPQALRPLSLTTAPHPGFPTDMQAQFVALLCMADGVSHIRETIFENRFMHVPELMRMGANIEQNGRNLVIHGGKPLKGAEVMATDLRASMSLVLAGLAAAGETTLNRVYHIDRGYEHIVRKLQGVGADIERVKG